MSKKSTKTRKAVKKPTAKQRALAAINAAMNESSVPLSPAAHDIADQANPNLADTPVENSPADTGITIDKAAGRLSGLDAAAKVLAEAGQPLNVKEMLGRMLAQRLWRTGGKTPQATIYAGIVREIMQKGDASRFRKTERGRFTIAS